MCGVTPPTGPQLLTANRGLIAKGLTATSGIHADGGNGGEAACLRRSERKRSRHPRACPPPVRAMCYLLAQTVAILGAR
eukprot:COSAG01_NODE_272_length_19747_cov_298.524023_19_plen_79_part_00